MKSRIERPIFRRSATVVGLLLLAAFGTYAGGTALVNSVLAADDPTAMLATRELALRTGSILMLTDALFVAVIVLLTGKRRV
jgi:uncharacterized membrane protein